MSARGEARRTRVAVVEEHEVLRYGLVACLAEDPRVDVRSAASAEALDVEGLDIAIVSSRLAEQYRFPCPIIVYGDTAPGVHVADGNDVAGALHRSSLTLSQIQATLHAVAAGLRVESGPIRAPADTTGPPPLELVRPVANEPDAPAPADQRCAVGYVCVTLDTAGSELPRHREAIQEWADENAVALNSIVYDVEQRPDDVTARPALHGALERLAAGEADTLVTATLAHLSPSVARLRPMLRRLTSAGTTLVAVDVGLDTATEAGRLAAIALTDVAGWEHDRLSARTRRGLQAARARGVGGGRASVADVPELRERIEDMRNQGMTLQAIADALNDDGVPTLRGGAKWRPSSVQRAAGYRRPPSSRWDVDIPGPASPRDSEEPAGAR